jgi:hypothetical protein
MKFREKYTELNKWISDKCRKTNAVVIGDPGIGNSTMLKVLFSSLKEDKQTVFWVMESGQWDYYINNCISTGFRAHEKSALWVPEHVRLLIDGKATDLYLSEMSRAVVFSSPQKGNYNTLIKATFAIKLNLPPWSKEEVDSLFVPLVDKG